MSSSKSFLPHGKSYIPLSIILWSLLMVVPGSVFNFVPGFLVFTDSFSISNSSFFIAFNEQYLGQSASQSFNTGLYVAAIFYGCFNVFGLLASIFFGGLFVRNTILYLTYSRWYKNILNGHTKIINSCKGLKFNDKVAMVVPTCNDFSPNTILQTAKQTYKNIDIGISDDSSKKDVIDAIDSFCKDHGFRVLHRDTEHKKKHPTKVGNLYFFLEKVGYKYDYIFENDSSSIVTSSFVENCMCYFKTPLWQHDKDGGIISNGSFYGAKNLISFLNSKSLQFSESIACSGGANQLLGGPVMSNGGGAMYKTETLRKIPLEKVECPICDSARGLGLTLNGYQNYLNPFDFTAKMSPQNMEALKNQKLKGNGGDVFLFRNGLINSKYSNIKTNIYVKSFAGNTDLMIPITFVLLIGNTILAAILNFFYVNITSIIIVTAFYVAFGLLLLAIFIKYKCSFKFFIALVFSGIGEAAIIYKRALQIIVKGYILHTGSSGVVTIKNTYSTTTKQKIKMSIFDLLIILLLLGSCLTMNFLLPHLNKFVIGVQIFVLFAGPSLLYLICVGFGEIKTSIGYDDKMKEYNFGLQDFRYKYVKETEIGKRQHPNE